MDDACYSANALPPFLAKTYEMVDDPSTDPIVSWSQNNKNFIVKNPQEFCRDLLPKYFKHSNFSSFIRQLNTYGFKKADPEQWEFANEDFVRGHPHLLKNIHRRKPVHSHSAKNLQYSSPLNESERQGYKDDIEKLKSVKESLQLELKRHEEDQRGFAFQMQGLSERVQQVEQRHKGMLSTLSQMLDKSELAIGLVPRLELHDRKRRFPRNNYMDYQESSSQILTTSFVNGEWLDRLESSVIFWENMLQSVCQTGIQLNSALEVDESTSCAGSPSVSQLSGEVGANTSRIDVNSEPNANPGPIIPTKEQAEVPGIATNVPTRVNDVFWEQFLTENPGSTDPLEVQSERKDYDGRKSERKPVDLAKFWWNKNNVNNLTEQPGHLTQAERT
ncbi:PREDICTED: heat stress transcription factor A-4c [Ipomoea nil]|uniref:heat stress transcription factor A-4c n=1 Tax=Ipomoea nil TaxID=35883 RepID=UPI0009008A0D|nr:PREDICTED: heat stress transcription factor A-4c [Ipomoea nil]XP_019166642.1 PREDICTED: heat stress transcription factor A-4c [Ipomoea nil]XP_019166643.1 PREDICTED: heat stress transcription factor A-4c [Ipomoea nil]